MIRNNHGRKRNMSMGRIRADLVIRNIGQLVSMRGYSILPCRKPSESSLGIIGNADSRSVSLAAKGETICYVGKTSELNHSVECTGAEEIDAKGRLVIPGFVDSHTHAIFAGSREQELADKISGLSYLEILRKGGGILKTMNDTRKAADSEIVQQTKERLERMLESGTTTVEIKTGYGLDLQNELRLLRLVSSLKSSQKIGIVATLLSAHAIPPEFHGEVSRYIEQVVKPSIDEASSHKLARFCDVFMEEGVFARAQTKQILRYAKSKGLGAKIHADEFTDLGGAEIASELAVVSADHLMKASPKGITSLGQSDVISVLLPGTTLSSLSSDYSNARAMIAAGCAVALATDMSPNSWIESMQLVMSLSCYGMRMTPAEALVSATINGAHSIGLACEIGSIEMGKRCDVLVMQLDRYEEIPYRVGSNSIDVVVKSGQVINSH
jgi:imidazolonepropionase